MPFSKNVRRNTIMLDGPWFFAYEQGPTRREILNHEELLASGLTVYDALVPGNLETDLIRHGILPDPLVGMNVLQLRELEACHAWYSCRFSTAPLPDCQTKLVFEGLDCFAEIYLNSQLIGTTSNMLVEHIFDVTSLIKSSNDLLIHFIPVRELAASYVYPVGVGAPATHYESLRVRKAPHMYGWDIMPRAVSMGIWRQVKLVYLPKKHINYLYLYTTALGPDSSYANLTLKYQLEGLENDARDYFLELSGECKGHPFHEKFPIPFKAGMHRFAVPTPHLWWPQGYGEPCLYRTTARLFRGENVLDEVEFFLGIRIVELHRTSITDEQGNGEFCFYINGEKVFIKGTNWVPLDIFHSRDASRLGKALHLVKDCNCNLVRCWGGNVYESNDFFNWCDAHGIMVWQDFAMACMVYPQDKAFQNCLAEEAKKVIQRLRQHPCLIVWSGDNECDLAYDWYQLGNPNRNVLTREVLPSILREEDPARPYIPSSPYIDEIAFTAGEKYLTEHHLWGPRNYYKSDFYRNALCHFASEIGYHGCPTPSSVRRFISPEFVWPYHENPEWDLHSTNPMPETTVFFPKYQRVELMVNQIRHMFASVPDNLEEFAFASQITQAEALKTFIESFRTAKWRRTGIIWWNLLDGWPQFSDAIVDYYFCKKLAYDYVRRAQQPVALMIREKSADRLELMVSNDTRENVSFIYKLFDIDYPTPLVSGKAQVPQNTSGPLHEFSISPLDKKFFVMEWSSTESGGKNHYLAGRPPFELNVYLTWLRIAGLIPTWFCKTSSGD